ncbi:hypothetical protein [Chitinilyticum litopenaei]|uniref:hypothetical protein n=1 Tax=Chitinilyticum litopenaei TaxID=1121276 RepID=UPI000406ED92|nr:hypothetical protein [Chitinilyticum litopenaei]
MPLRLLVLVLIPLLSACSAVATTVAVGGAAVGLAGTAVSVATTTAGVAWDVGAAGVNGAVALANHAASDQASDVADAQPSQR